jgi:hypothetical protein
MTLERIMKDGSSSGGEISVAERGGTENLIDRCLGEFARSWRVFLVW